MTQTEQLMADLTATAEAGYYLDNTEGGYFDWSTGDGDGTYRMEAGTDTDAVQIDMTRDQLLALQQRLTAWLLATK